MKLPLVFKENGWYFYDETWSVIYGPFHNHIEATAQFHQYAEELDQLFPRIKTEE